MLNLLRHRIGGRLLAWALATLPCDSSEFIGCRRGLAEQRDYDRYEGYTRLLAGDVLPFDRWREQWRWIAQRKVYGIQAVTKPAKVVQMRKAATR